jgi:glycosyltransferase involved in cell wall biosynthesis
VGRYTKSLVEHLGALKGEDQLDLFYFDFQRKGTPFATPAATQHAIHWCPGRVVQYAWRTLGAPPFNWFAPRADVYHFTNFIRPPLTRGRSVVTIHDMSFMRHPHTLEDKNYQYLAARLHDTVARAEAIITISHFTAREIGELLDADQDRITAVPLGIDPGWAPAGPDAIQALRNDLGLDRPYLLTVGTLEPRKNIPFLVEVFEQLEAFDGDLVIAGMPGWKHEPILERMRTSTRADRIRNLRFVDEQHMAALYTGAELFCFPSLYEGFGFPPLEAMACGTPVVSSAGGSLPEVLADAAVVIEPFDPDRWVEALMDLLEHPEQKAHYTSAGQARTKQFTWQETARRTWDVYRRVGS